MIFINDLGINVDTLAVKFAKTKVGSVADNKEGRRNIQQFEKCAEKRQIEFNQYKNERYIGRSNVRGKYMINGLTLNRIDVQKEVGLKYTAPWKW